MESNSKRVQEIERLSVKKTQLNIAAVSGLVVPAISYVLSDQSFGVGIVSGLIGGIIAIFSMTSALFAEGDIRKIKEKIRDEERK